MTKDCVVVDGSQGEGGGQILRSSLALATVLQRPIRISNIRAGRKKPGLLRQHLTALRACAEISQARTAGAHLGSQEIEFDPQEVRGGRYRFRVGSAGSACLVAQTILPALAMTKLASRVSIEGGTHADWAPPFDYLERVFLQLFNRMGPQVQTTIEKYGFYPAGGGLIHLEIQPCASLRKLELTTVTDDPQPFVRAIVSQIPLAVAERECETIRRKTYWKQDCFAAAHVESPGPGNVVFIELEFKNSREIFTGFGKPGVKAEHIARNTLKAMQKFASMKVPVGEYLADQLLLPMGLAAMQGQYSCFRTIPLSQHSLTHIEVLKKFLDIEICVNEIEPDIYEVRLGPQPSQAASASTDR